MTESTLKQRNVDNVKRKSKENKAGDNTSSTSTLISGIARTAATSTTRDPTSPKEPTSPKSPVSPKGAPTAEDSEEKTQKLATRVRTVESWLDGALEGADESGGGKKGGKKKGLANYNIDPSALDNLGLDPQQTERIYRALMVYSQGVHLLLNDAVNCTKHRSQALLILWRAFTAVLENAAPGDKSGAGGASFSELMQKGNADHVGQIEKQYKDLMREMEHKNSTLATEKREGQNDLENLKGDKQRLENQIHMYQQENETTLNKYELALRQRMSAETRFLEKEHWEKALQHDLDKAKRQVMHLTKGLDEANETKEELLVDRDKLRSNARSYDVAEQTHKQQALESAQAKIRFEHQIETLTDTNERLQKKMEDAKEQMAKQKEHYKSFDAQMTQALRDYRKMETAYEDEAHKRNELQKIVDDLKKRLEETDKALTNEIEECRQGHKEISELRLNVRTTEVELHRKREQVAQLEKEAGGAQEAVKTLTDEARELKVECDYLKEDVTTIEEQLRKENEIRKMLQMEKKRLIQELDTAVAERDNARVGSETAKKELMELTKKNVKMESIVRQCEQAKAKLELEHSIERRTHAKRIALLEKVIADEREVRRELATETVDTKDQMNEKHQKVMDLQELVRELRKQRLEYEEEADRGKILVHAQERRVEELLTVIDRHHAAASNHDAEIRQMQVVLENEREESQRQLVEMRSAFDKGRHTMEQRIDGWQMRFEDALSLLHFNPATLKIQKLQHANEELEKQLNSAKAFGEAQKALVFKTQDELAAESRKVSKTEDQVKLYREKYESSEARFEELLVEYEKRSVAMADMEEQADRLYDQMSNFDAEREALEDKIQQLLKDKKSITAVLTKVKHDAVCQVNPRLATQGQQTDLSYQYLENEKKMQDGPRRQEQLNRLAKAGRFADDVGTSGTQRAGLPSTIAQPSNELQQNQFAAPQVGIGQGQQSRSGLVFSKPQTMPLRKPPMRQQPPSRESTTAGSARPTTRGTLGTAGTMGSGSRRASGMAVPTIAIHRPGADEFDDYGPSSWDVEPWDQDDDDEDY